MSQTVTIKDTQRQTWGTGDYSAVGSRIVITSEQLLEALDPRGGQRALDVATGSGNAALAAARRGCDVVGVDYVESLLERGRLRAAAEGLEVDFRLGDAESLAFPDRSFDLVFSVFGSMFAPDQQSAASELVRVCRPGGKIGLASWTPDGFVGQWFRAVGSHVTPPPGLRPPMEWGTEARLRELFGDQVDFAQVTRREFLFRFRSTGEWLEFFRTHFGPMVKAFAALSPEQGEKLASDLLAVAERNNRADDGTMLVPSAYLEVVAVRR